MAQITNKPTKNCSLKDANLGLSDTHDPFILSYQARVLCQDKKEGLYRENMKTESTDILVIGSGLAALAFALKMSPHRKIIILTKATLAHANSAMAQGGVASVMSAEDSFESHIQDTLTAGDGLCNIEAVRNIIEQAPDRIHELYNWGVRFDIKPPTGNSSTESFQQSVDLHREGGHTFRRILHFEDQTGAEIIRALIEQVRKNTNIQIYENHFAIDLIVNKQINPLHMGATKCIGAYVLDTKQDEVKAFTAPITVLATGGAGKVYQYTSNWSGATGDGIAMAYRVGARVANLEFMQFHPTCLFHRDSRNFLITEALRGEGGELINDKNEAFMKRHHSLGSLAPRDITARSIDAEMKKSGSECVFLDIRKHSREFLESHFPAIFQKCLSLGIDMSKQPIPVVPAAHYLCGGVLTDVHGQTDLEQLFAIGETACTGLHGANRLASNSLLECLAMAHNAAEKIKQNWNTFEKVNQSPKPWVSPELKNDDEMIVISHMWEEVRRLMWNYVGIVRSTKRLERAQHRLKNILSEVKEYYSNMKIHSDIIELRNIALVADLTVECALRRKESRGIHYSLDYPQTLVETPKNTILLPLRK